MVRTIKAGLIVISLTSLGASAETARWEPGKVTAVEQVSTPAKTPDPDCHTLPRGATIPARCRAANLRAETFWRVTVEVGNKRYVVRPYRAPKLLDSLNQEGPFYVDPNLTAGTTLEVAVYANKSVRLRTDKGDGVPAILDSEDTIEKAEVSAKVESSPPVRAPAAPAPSSASKVVLLENGDFIDLENQELKAQDIGDGAVLYSFAGDSSSTRIGSARPVFLVMMPGNIELARVQVGKGNRQLLYSAAKKHSASPLAVNVSQVSDTLRRITVSEPLAPGEYVLLVIDSNKDDSSRAYLFEAR